MGFEKGRVSRAAQHLGNDEKKVFEYLFQIQALEDMGFDCDDSEYAFTKNEFDMEKAKHFLTSMRQLCEVGFKREAVIKALLQAGSDRDKALDHLLSSQ
ncbi:Ubiquitin-associated protein 1-like protein [Leptotrombidium deliense]|uniref:Ubiquitin-associated protein 1-like protein n=1 Tax=Leptotrombidium deliense TaxID=299467 RepID=A0A443SPT6_9ACAR|nr:Ubiquitin-associated protein 1-like protein [Leptotrombidium deliense]